MLCASEKENNEKCNIIIFILINISRNKILKYYDCVCMNILTFPFSRKKCVGINGITYYLRFLSFIIIICHNLWLIAFFEEFFFLAHKVTNICL